MATPRQALRPVAVLDAAVLVPAGLRDLLLSCADVGMFRPVWQSELEAETVRNVTRLRVTRGGASSDEAAAYATRTIAAMNSAFPDARLPDGAWRGKVAAMINDPKDRHVLAVAVGAGATHVVTLNLRDFPTVSRPAGVLVQAPDRFLLERLGEDASGVRGAVEAMAGRHVRPAHTPRELAAPSRAAGSYRALARLCSKPCSAMAACRSTRLCETGFGVMRLSRCRLRRGGCGGISRCCAGCRGRVVL